MLSEQVMVLEQEWICIGEILRPQGNRGEVRVRPFTPYPERFGLLGEVHVGSEDDDHPAEYRLQAARQQREFVVLALEGVDSIDDAEELRGCFVHIRPDQLLKLPEGEFFVFELLGLEVYDETGVYWGEVEDIIDSPANDVFVVRKEGAGDSPGQVLIPAVSEFIKDVDLDRGRITFRPIPGMEGDTGAG